MYTSTSSSFVSTSKKAIFAGLISAAVAGATLIGAASPALASTRGWIREGNTWSYQVSKDTYAKGWYYTPSGKWFYFNKDNYQMVTGKLTDDNKDYWLDENAGLLYDRWVQDAKGNWLHTDDNGVLVTGWFKTKSGYWFYFNQDHTMKTGILTDRGYTFWLDKNDGLLYNEWVKDSKGNWLHTDGNGCLVTGWYHAPNGKWFYFDSNYKMVTGKLTDDNKDYWLDENAGLLYDRWVQDNQGNWLHTDDNGCLLTGWYHAPNGKWFYFNQDHTLRTDPLVEKGNRYYFDVNMGLIRTEPLTQGSESANKPSSSSTGRSLGTNKNHKPYGATRWVVDKPAWTEKIHHSITKYKNGHVVDHKASEDSPEYEWVIDTPMRRWWNKHKQLLTGKANKFNKRVCDLTPAEADIEFRMRKFAMESEHEAAQYDGNHTSKKGEPANSTVLQKVEIVEHPEQGHWE